VNIAYRLLIRFLEICVLRAGPQDLPASYVLLGIATAAYMLAGVLALISAYGPAVTFSQAILDGALLGGYTWGLLRLKGRAERFVQTFTALTGTGALLGFVALPFVQGAFDAGAGSGSVGIALLVLFFWSIAVIGHVYRHALDLRGIAAGVAAAMGYVVASFVVMRIAFPET
jgi:hypothetical protein